MFTALAGACNKTARTSCQPVHLDAPVKRDAWVGQNKEVVAQQAASIENWVWLPFYVSVRVGALWEASNMKVQVHGCQCCDDVFFLSLNMTIRVNNAILKERIPTDRPTSEVVFQPCIQTLISDRVCLDLFLGVQAAMSALPPLWREGEHGLHRTSVSHCVLCCT